MLNIRKKYLTDENNKPVAVQLDIDTYNKIEQLLEDYALGQLIEQNDPSEYLSPGEAKSYYRRLKK